MKRLASLLLLFALLPCRAWAGQDSADEIAVTGEGVAALEGDLAAAEEEALWDAKRNAVEQAAGVFLKAEALGKNFELSREEIRAQSAGFLRHWEYLPDSRQIERVGNGRLLRLKIRASVALLPVLRRLEDMQEAYNDLDRPRLCIVAAEGLEEARTLLRQRFLREGFPLADAPESAAILVQIQAEMLPLLRFGDATAPYGLGETVATCRARLTVSVSSVAAEETLLALRAEAVGSSLQSDAEARTEAAREAAQSLIDNDAQRLMRTLLLRWAKERQEGAILALEVQGLPQGCQDALRDALAGMRGFREFAGESRRGESVTIRFLTRLSARDARRRLANFRHLNFTLAVREERGAIIHCAARPRPRSTPSLRSKER